MEYSKGKWFVSIDGKIRERATFDAGFSDYVCSMPFSSESEAQEMPKASIQAQLIAGVPEMFETIQECIEIEKETNPNSVLLPKLEGY